MIRRRVVWLVWMTMAIMVVLRAEGGRQGTAADSRFEQLSALVAHEMAAEHIPGAAFGVMKSGQIRTRGFGVTNIDDPQGVTPQTLFALASISKTVTATAIMNLVDQGKIDLDAPVRRYIPEFQIRDEAASRDVTIRHLLTHTPGWEGQLIVPDRGTETLANFVHSMRDLPQLAPPGAVWSYNNAGFTVAGRVIEVVTGKPFQDALSDLVFRPAQLSSATTILGEVTSHRFAVGHRQRGGQTEVVRPFLLSANPPAGGVAMNLVDLLAYARFHLTGPPWLARMRAPQMRKNATDDDMGIAWQLRTVGGVRTAAHGGTASGGLCLLLELVPERNLAFAILTNHTDGWRLIQRVERSTLELYEGVSLAPNQGIGHRGVNEAMSHTTPLTNAPATSPFVGVYTRAPLGTIRVRDEGGTLMVDGEGVGGAPGNALSFYSPDRAFLVDGPSARLPVEFIRNGEGRIEWIRINGRIARRIE